MYCNLPRGHYSELLRQDRRDRSFSPAASNVDGYSSSDAALSECCATWYTWLRACEAWWTSRCNMLARHYTLHVHMCPIIAPQDTHWPGRRALTFARSRDLCLACSADLSLGTGSTSATLLSMTCCRLYVVTQVVRSYVDRVSERFMQGPVDASDPLSGYTSYRKLYNFVLPIRVLKTFEPSLWDLG